MGSGFRSFLATRTQTEMVILTSGHLLIHNIWVDLPQDRRVLITLLLNLDLRRGEIEISLSVFL